MLLSSLTFALSIFSSISVTVGQDTSLATVKATFQEANVGDIAFVPIQLKMLNDRTDPRRCVSDLQSHQFA